MGAAADGMEAVAYAFDPERVRFDVAAYRRVLPPSKPRWKGPSSLVLRANFKVRQSWQRFIDNIYWNSELEGS